jgi:hypothetical protein
MALQDEGTAGARRSLAEAKAILESLDDQLYRERLERLLLQLD